MDFVKQLKEQINIADVVGEYVRLRKTGSNYMGLCPFHAERSPSFSVTEKRKIYHCFGCQKSGDVISFVQEIQAVSFHEAIRILAAKYNIKLPPEFAARGGSGAARPAEDKLEIYYKLNRFVAQFYHEKLLAPEGKAAREYLEKRGVSAATIKNAYIGYASAEWAELHDFLVEKKAPLDKAEELGLIRRKEKADNSGRAHYDLFRDRVMFPVIDTRGRVIAFGGRALGNVEGPKYINSTESPIYKKGSYLFGLFAAQKEIRAEDLCVVVEGFMDCLSLQQAGIGYTVAALGTALTERQAALLKRLTRNIVLLFDGDSAGQSAQIAAMETFLNEDVVVRGIVLPDEYDPDEFIQEKGAEPLAQLLRNAPYLLDQRILELVTQAGAHAEARSRVVDQILPWVAKISSETARLVRIQELGNLFDLESAALERRVEQLRSQHPRKAQSPAVAAAAAQRPQAPRGYQENDQPPSQRFGGGQKFGGPQKFQKKFGDQPSAGMPQMPGVPRLPRSEVDSLDGKFIEYAIAHPRLFQDALAKREDILSGFETDAARQVAVKLLDSLSAPVGSEALDWTESRDLRAVISKSLILAEQEQAHARTPDEEQQLSREVQDLERKLIRRGLERQKDTLRAMINKADGSGQSTEFSRLMSQYNELVRKLDETKGGQVNL